MAYVDATLYQHPMDKQTLSALKAVPGFSAFMKAVMKVYSERRVYINITSSAIELSERQLPEIYDRLPPICEKLGIAVPHLYLANDRSINAFTSNENDPIIVLHTGLLECCSDEVVSCIIAHECGHIACHHVLYHVIGNMILNGAINFIPGIGPLISMGLQYSFFSWLRASEYSADRASAVAMGGSRIPVDTMASLAGDYASLGLNVDKNVFLEQALLYEQTINESTTNKIFEIWQYGRSDHPLTAYRALEVVRWCETPEFQRTQDILSGNIALPATSMMPSSDMMPAAAFAPASQGHAGKRIRDRMRDLDPRRGSSAAAGSFDSSPQSHVSGLGNDSAGNARFCMNCGRPIQEGHMFCANCGSKLS